MVLEKRPGADNDRPTAVAFVAGVGKEIVRFDPVVKCVGKAEQYLLTLLQAQIITLSKALANSFKRYPTQNRIEWLMKKDAKEDPVDPAQIALLVSHMDFVMGVEKALFNYSKGDKLSVSNYFDSCKQQLASLISLTQTMLTKGDRQRIMCMITLDAHNRDIVDILIKERAMKQTDFQWQSKLRPKFVQDGKKTSSMILASGAEFRICDAAFEYGFEYLGNGPRLVVTPLTDRIYVTATQALNLKMGCAPAGPAGTGKTGRILLNHFLLE